MTKIADAIAQKLWPGSPLRHDACCRRTRPVVLWFGPTTRSTGTRLQFGFLPERQDRILCCQSHGFDRARHGALPSGPHLRFLVRKLNPEAETLAPRQIETGEIFFPISVTNARSPARSEFGMYGRMQQGLAKLQLRSVKFGRA